MQIWVCKTDASFVTALKSCGPDVRYASSPNLFGMQKLPGTLAPAVNAAILVALQSCIKAVYMPLLRT